MKTSEGLPSAGLRVTYAKRSAESVKKVEQAISTLRSAGRTITLTNIVSASLLTVASDSPSARRPTPISHATILRNPVCRALYEAAATPKRRTKSPIRPLRRVLGNDLTDKHKARMRYLLRKPKAELIALILTLERQAEVDQSANAELRDALLTSRLGK